MQFCCRYLTVDYKPESMCFYERLGFKVLGMYRQNDFPKGFESKKLEYVCTLITDGTHDKTPLVDKKEGVPLITSKDLKD
ncbi:MAG: hypothetical protein HF976_06525 [ANME-2 cluster archaeon]|nr:hypothetical protein [ANME-2 cluster archaeon]